MPRPRHIKVPRRDRIFSLAPRSGRQTLFVNNFTCSLLEHAIRLNRMEDIYQNGRLVPGDAPFSDKLLQGMSATYRVSDEDRARIPAEGPVVVVANHPFGGLEGVVLHSLLRSRRRDVKLMANTLLGRVPELREDFILVNPFGTTAAKSENIRPLIECRRFLASGGALGVFPAGEVSSIDLKTGRVRDPAWSRTIAGLVRRSKATVVPVFFSGHNGPGFQFAGVIHPRLRTLLLPKMFAKLHDSSLQVSVGAPIPWSELEGFASDDDLIQYLRLRTYALEARESAAPPKKPRRLSLFRRHPRVTRQADIIPPVPPEQLAAEIDALPPDAKALESGDNVVYIARAANMPSVLRELGRLREITFRAVGEGTGREIDLDPFDQHYLHLFIWNRAKREIVGAYRLGPGDEIIARYGVEGLYTHTLFRFDERLVKQIGPCIELGRSFVRPEYQKAYSSLLLLWKGIGAFIAAHPQYTTLFGPVSITAEYRDTSRNLLLRALSVSNFAPELARLVRPRNPPRRRRPREAEDPDFEKYTNDVESVTAIIQDIESDRKGIPILLRQYLKLGGRILAFNVDEDFSSVVDGFIMIDLRETDPRILTRYMGEEAVAAFRRHHGIG